MGNVGLDVTVAYFAVRAVFVVVWLGGIAWAVARFRRHREVSILVIVALGCLLLGTLGSALATMYVVSRMAAPDAARATMWINMAGSSVQLISWGCLLAAIFGWRSPAYAAARASTARETADTQRTNIPRDAREQASDNPYQPPHTPVMP